MSYQYDRALAASLRKKVSKEARKVRINQLPPVLTIHFSFHIL